MLYKHLLYCLGYIQIKKSGPVQYRDVEPMAKEGSLCYNYFQKEKMENRAGLRENTEQSWMENRLELRAAEDLGSIYYLPGTILSDSLTY